jgi:hypothetical protein
MALGAVQLNVGNGRQADLAARAKMHSSISPEEGVDVPASRYGIMQTRG